MVASNSPILDPVKITPTIPIIKNTIFIYVFLELIMCINERNRNSLYKTFAPKIKYALPASSLNIYDPIRKKIIRKNDKNNGGLK